MRPLGLTDEREVPEQVVEQQRSRGRDLVRVGSSGTAAARTSGRLVEQPGRRVVAWVGDQRAVAAEHRRRDDAGQHGNARSGVARTFFRRTGGG